MLSYQKMFNFKNKGRDAKLQSKDNQYFDGSRNATSNMNMILN